MEKSLFRLIKIPEIFDDCFLYFAHVSDHIPFSIKRIYYISKANTRLPRGFHAHIKNQQIMFCISGSIKLVLDNGRKRKHLILNKPNIGRTQQRKYGGCFGCWKNFRLK